MVDQVDEIKQKTDIVSLLSEYLPLKKAGRNYKTTCPFHGEKTPSFMVSPELQMYKCFGCQKAGDVFSFLEEYEGMEFREALKFLADRTGVKLVVYKPGEETEKEKILKINNLAKSFYTYILLNHPSGKPALDYLTRERGLKLPTIKTFELGFSPDVPNVLKKFLVDKKKFTPTDVEKAGLGYPQRGQFIDKFRGRVIFPLTDHRGNCVGFAGRILPGARDAELAKYINSPETPVYHKSKLLFGLNLTKSEIKAQKEAILVEGELDAISSWQAGVKNIVAIKGSALTADQVALLSRFCQKIIFALDTDFAGDAAAQKGVIIAQNQGLEVRVADLGKFKDPDEAARGDIVFYQSALQKAVGIWDFIIDIIFARSDASSGEGKAKVSREIVPVLAGIADKIIQAHYAGVVAQKLEVPQEAVNEQINQFVNQKGEEQAQKSLEAVKPVEKSRQQLLEERLLALAFQSDPKILAKKEIGKLMVTPLSKRLFEEYLNYAREHLIFNPQEFAKILPKELLPGFAEMVLREVKEAVADPDDVTREIDLVVSELQALYLHRRLEELGVKIRDYETADDKTKLVGVQNDFRNTTQKLSKLEEARKQGIILQEV